MSDKKAQSQSKSQESVQTQPQVQPQEQAKSDRSENPGGVLGYWVRLNNKKYFLGSSKNIRYVRGIMGAYKSPPLDVFDFGGNFTGLRLHPLKEDEI